MRNKHLQRLTCRRMQHINQPVVAAIVARHSTGMRVARDDEQPLTTHHSPLTTHHSPLTTHHSPLTSSPIPTGTLPWGWCLIRYSARTITRLVEVTLTPRTAGSELPNMNEHSHTARRRGAFTALILGLAAAVALAGARS